MSKIYLKVMPDGSAKAFGDMASVNAPLEVGGAGGEYDAEASLEDWEQAGHRAYVKDGRIVLGVDDAVALAEQEEAIRFERKQRLRKIDKLNPLFWEELSEDQMQALRDYRRALLDITDQEGFPWGGNIEVAPWPEKPAFFEF